MKALQRTNTGKPLTTVLMEVVTQISCRRPHTNKRRQQTDGALGPDRRLYLGYSAHLVEGRGSGRCDGEESRCQWAPHQPCLLPDLGVAVCVYTTTRIIFLLLTALYPR